MDPKKSLILVIDDIEQNVALVSQILRSNDYQVIAAFSGEGALRILEKRIPDLILVDVMMPDMDGFEVCSRIKQNDSLKSIPVIFLSALSDVEVKVRGLEVGGVDYITKPFQALEVLARVGNHLKISKLEKERKQHIENLIALNDEKDKLMQIVSHDLRSPLGGIYGLADILRTGAEATDVALVREFAAIIASTSNQLLRLVNDLLDLAKIESGNMQLDIQEFNLAHTIYGCMQLLKNVAQSKGVELLTHIDDETVLLWADEPKIIQIINNLLSNAVKFTPQGGSVTVDVLCNENGWSMGSERTVKIVVRDTGIGIAAEDIPKVFDKFGKHQRAGTAGEQGTGLGMPIVKRFVELHNGCITVESRVGQGTTMSVFLPARIE
ncbi:MAG: hybrid sensor histidine kinase/response regulator [Candidatus Kapaibacterium sp.]